MSKQHLAIESGGLIWYYWMYFIKWHKDTFVKNLDISNFLIYLEKVYEVSEGYIIP